MITTLFDDLSNAATRAALESSVEVDEFFDTVNHSVLNQIRRSLSEASIELRRVEIEYDNALAGRADSISNGDDPTDDQRDTIEEDRYQNSDHILERLASSIPRFIQYIITSLKHAGYEAEAPTNKAEAIALIMKIIVGDPYNERDEDQFPIPEYRFYRLDRVLEKCSFNVPGSDLKFTTTASIGDDINNAFNDNIPF